MRWYGDNSEASGIWKAEIPDLALFGGILIETEAGRILEQRICDAKGRYTALGRWPMKWNFNDLRSLYERRNRGKLFQTIQQDSKKWRSEMVVASLDVDY